MDKMTSNKPYLLRAFYDWIVDNQCTPYVVVDAHAPGVNVPQSYVTDGQIVLNLAPRAVTAFHMDLESICFNTRFGGVPTDIAVPVAAVMGIYARENGQGMIFQPETNPEPTPPAGGSGPKGVPSGKPPASGSGKSAKRPSLKVIK